MKWPLFKKNRLRRAILSFSHKENHFFKNSQIRGLWEQFNFVAVADHQPKNLPLDPALIGE